MIMSKKIAFILKNSSPLLLEIKLINLVHSNDEEEILFKNFEFYGSSIRSSCIRVKLK